MFSQDRVPWDNSTAVTLRAAILIKDWRCQGLEDYSNIDLVP